MPRGLPNTRYLGRGKRGEERTFQYVFRDSLRNQYLPLHVDLDAQEQIRVARSIGLVDDVLRQRVDVF